MPKKRQMPAVAASAKPATEPNQDNVRRLISLVEDLQFALHRLGDQKALKLILDVTSKRLPGSLAGPATLTRETMLKGLECLHVVREQKAWTTDMTAWCLEACDIERLEPKVTLDIHDRFTGCVWEKYRKLIMEPWGDELEYQASEDCYGTPFDNPLTVNAKKEFLSIAVADESE